MAYALGWMWTRTPDGLGTTTYPLTSDLFRTTYLVSIELGLKWEDSALVYSSLT